MVAQLSVSHDIPPPTKVEIALPMLLSCFHKVVTEEHLWGRHDRSIPLRLRYMPAELLMEGKMTKAADVYSFAMLMHELLTGQQLFEGMRQSQASAVRLLPYHSCSGPAQQVSEACNAHREAPFAAEGGGPGRCSTCAPSCAVKGRGLHCVVRLVRDGWLALADYL